MTTSFVDLEYLSFDELRYASLSEVGLFSFDLSHLKFAEAT